MYQHSYGQLLLAMSLLHCLIQRSQPCHSTTTHALAHFSAATSRLAAVAISKIFTPLSQVTCSSFSLIHTDPNGWGAISTIKSSALQAILTWLGCDGIRD
ncbi:predicted protein [Lichtheimia corymbifera JMRC:FSU:9682]|uniref:Secreted protein n=1 Tax=Lichtheimia corymbifera JMRC:FSU:9682 TaxID=1263082 RepID=A0A068RIZ7_9FUNG|nr:predicted protein [Lichtheimia corymbifera JMRC:FSU:9682]